MPAENSRTCTNQSRTHHLSCSKFHRTRDRSIRKISSMTSLLHCFPDEVMPTASILCNDNAKPTSHLQLTEAPVDATRPAHPRTSFTRSFRVCRFRTSFAGSFRACRLVYAQWEGIFTSSWWALGLVGSGVCHEGPRVGKQAATIRCSYVPGDLGVFVVRAFLVDVVTEKWPRNSCMVLKQALNRCRKRAQRQSLSAGLSCATANLCSPVSAAAQSSRMIERTTGSKLALVEYYASDEK